MTSSEKPHAKPSLASRAFCRLLMTVMAGWLLFAAGPLHATRIKLSDEPVSPMADYNFLLFRNLRMALTGVLQLTADDNINTSENNPDEGIYVVPRLRLAIDWPITPNIQIGSGLSLGYRYYLYGDGEDNLYVGLDDDLDASAKVDIFLGDGVLRIANTFRREADTLEIAGRSRNDDYVLNRNTISARYSFTPDPFWSVIAKIGSTYSWTNTKEFKYHNNLRNFIDIVTLWEVNPQLRLGPYFRYEEVSYGSDTGGAALPNNDRKVPEAGVSFVYRYEADVTLQGSLGYEKLNIESNAFADDETGGFTGRIALNFATSEYTDHVLSINHDRDQDILSPFVNYSQETTYMYAIASNIMPDLTLRGDLSLLDIRESDLGENATIWRVGLGTSYQIGPKTRIRFRYEFWDKSSDRNNRDYTRNRLSTFLEYDF